MTSESARRLSRVHIVPAQSEHILGRILGERESILAAGVSCNLQYFEIHEFYRPPPHLRQSSLNSAIAIAKGSYAPSFIGRPCSTQVPLSAQHSQQSAEKVRALLIRSYRSFPPVSPE
jgi:hypothetical protein